MESSRPSTVSFTCEQMATSMKSDILTGADGTDIKCGVIGEIGCSWSLKGIHAIINSPMIDTLSIGFQKIGLD